MEQPNELMTWEEMVKRYPSKWVIVEKTAGNASTIRAGIVRYVVDDNEIDDIPIFVHLVLILKHYRNWLRNNISLFFIQNYQSFEFLLLCSSMIDDQELNNFVADNVLLYKSREELYEARLKSLTTNLPNHYSKKKDEFPVCYYKLDS